MFGYFSFSFDSSPIKLSDVFEFLKTYSKTLKYLIFCRVFRVLTKSRRLLSGKDKATVLNLFLNYPITPLLKS